jgi:hypothetical protein
MAIAFFGGRLDANVIVVTDLYPLMRISVACARSSRNASTPPFSSRPWSGRVGIMGDRLANGNLALALLANSLATGAVLVTLIFTFGPISGAHFNRAVTMASALEGGFAWRRVPGYLAAQREGRSLV